jgi:hypothetical protein
MANEAAANQENTEPSIFSISGFGTLGVVHSSEKNADFTSNIYRPDGAGHTHTWSADVDSLIGVQLNANFTPKLSAVLQIVAEQNAEDNYRPHVEWAFVKYQFTPDFSVNVGRTVIPTFLVSEYRKVGYANPWVRPPLEVYRLLPVTKSDGVSASYRMHFGEVTNTLQALHGKLEVDNTFGERDQANDQWGLFNTMQYKSLTLRLSYLQSNLELGGTEGFFDALRSFGPEGDALAERYECDGKSSKLASIGASYDPGDWFLMGEFSRLDSHCFIGNQSGWYISGGYRFDKFTPYITYAESKAESNTTDPGLSSPFAAGLNAGLNGFLGSIPQQKTITVGTRWDFMKNTALKLQYDHSRFDNDSAGGLINPQPDFNPGGHVNLISATLDFVF